MYPNILVVLCLLSSLLNMVEATSFDNTIFTISGPFESISSVSDNKKIGAIGFSNTLRKVCRFRGGASGVFHISSTEMFDRLVSESDGKLIVVDFSASWCMPCKLIAPVFEEMASSDGEFAGVIFMKIDVDEVPELAERFQVQAMPTFLFMKANEEVDRFSGASVEKLKQTIVAHLA